MRNPKPQRRIVKLTMRNPKLHQRIVKLTMRMFIGKPYYISWATWFCLVCASIVM